MSALAAMAVGTAISLYGQKKQLDAADESAAAQAAFLEQQALFAEEIGRREQEIIGRNFANLRAQQKNVFAHNGLDFSGSVVDAVGNTYVQEIAEIEMSKLQAEFNTFSARSQGQSALDAASAAKEGFKLQAAGTVLSSAAPFFKK